MLEVLFVNATKELAVNKEVNGTLLLGTKLLAAGFTTDVLRFGEIEGYQRDYETYIRRATDRILSYEPKCVSFYTLWPYFHVMLRIARELKAIRPEILIVMGGPQASATAKAIMEAMDYVDYVCTGEGEDTVIPFFTAVLRNGGEGIDKVPGLYYRENGIVTYTNIEVPLCDLETLPQWDDRLYLDHYTEKEPYIEDDNYFMNIDVGRGCPYNCSFCSSSYFWRRTYRLKTPERIVEDIRYFHDKFGIRSFGFSHDAFTTNLKLVDKVCDHFIEQGLDITWNCTARIDCIDEDLIMKMKKTGMTQIELGIETGSLRMQKITHKNLNLDRAKHMVDFVIKSGVKIGLFFMCGFPEETIEDLEDTLNLMFELLDKGIHYASMSYCRFNPNTEITNKYFDQLVFDPTIKFMGRGIYGYDEELDVIKANKAIFPFFFHYETPLRREFQYLTILTSMYLKFPHSAKYIRRLYNGDNIAFYRDFIKCNQDTFDDTIFEISKMSNLYPVKMFTNMLEQFDLPYMDKLKALLQYDFDYQSVKGSKDGTVKQTIYGFDYAEVEEGISVENLSDKHSLVRFERNNGHVSKTAFRVN